jgi:phospholipid/cholesterol/gamma-HCH transport system substrate-binding protein
MNRTAIDLWVGIFVAIGLAAIVFLALKVGNLTSLDAVPSYRLDARFDNIGGLKVRAPVKAAGVVVGRVDRIRLDPKTYEAVVGLSDRQWVPVHQGFDRIHPYFRPAG